MAWYDAVGSFFTGDKSAEAKAAYDKYMNEMGAAKTGYTGAVDTSMKPYTDLAAQGDYAGRYQDYLDSLSGLDTEQYKVTGAQTSEINPLDAVNSYIDPNVKYQQEAARKGIEESAAGKGGLFSGATGSAIATSQEELAAKAWNEAMNKAQGVQESENQRRIAQQTASQNAGTYNLGLDTTKTGALGTAFETAMNPLDTVTQANLSKAGTVYGADTGAAGTGYNYGMQIANQPSGWEQFMGTVGQVGQAVGNVAKAKTGGLF